jgi:hypothetical protein
VKYIVSLFLARFFKFTQVCAHINADVKGFAQVCGESVMMQYSGVPKVPESSQHWEIPAKSSNSNNFLTATNKHSSPMVEFQRKFASTNRLITLCWVSAIPCGRKCFCRFEQGKSEMVDDGGNIDFPLFTMCSSQLSFVSEF